MASGHFGARLDINIEGRCLPDISRDIAKLFFFEWVTSAADLVLRKNTDSPPGWFDAARIRTPVNMEVMHPDWICTSRLCVDWEVIFDIDEGFTLRVFHENSRANVTVLYFR
jgi:hypothetical protein